MSHLEETLLWQIKAAGLPMPEREYRAIKGRKFKYDFAWTLPHHRLLVEVQGGIWSGGSHGRGWGIKRDMTKLNLAMLAGWRVMQFDTGMVENGEALDMIAKALGVEL